MNLNFSSGLLLFTAILTSIYLLMMIIHSRTKLRPTPHTEKTFPAKTILVVAYILAGLITAIKFFSETSILYFVLIPVLVSLLLILIAKTSTYTPYLVCLTIFIHLIVLSLIFPESGLFITERSPALIMLERYNAWNPDWALLNSYYNPFPMEQGVYHVLSQITSLSYLTYFFVWIINAVFVIGYDLTLFSFSRKLSGDWRVGCLAIFFMSFTPPLILSTQPQWLGNVFVLLLMFGLLKALKDSPSISSIILINLSYALAIILHGTAAIALVFVAVLFLLMLFGRKLGINIATTRPQRSFVFSVFTSISVITLGRWIMFGGIYSILNPLSGLYNQIFSTIETTWIGSTYVPLYDQYVSPISAYSWSVPISLVITFVLYQLITHKKKKSLTEVFSSSMGIAAAGLTIVGFLGSMFMAHGNLQRYLGYSGMSLFIPIAAFVCVKFLRTSYVKIVGVALISLILFSGIGIFDPAISPALYEDFKSVNPTRSIDIVESETFYKIFPDGTSIIATYEILTGVWYVSLIPEAPNRTIGGYASSLKTHRIMIERLVEDHEILDGVTYIWSSDLYGSIADIPINVIYSSGRHVVVGGQDV